MKKAFYYKAIYLMILPALLHYLIFCYAPMYGIIIAFKDYWFSKGIMGSPWVGFDNFRILLALDKFWQVFWNTVLINVLKLIFVFPAPVILALMLNEIRNRIYKRIIQTMIYLPHFISWVVISGIIISFLSIDGLVNNLLALFDAGRINFLIHSSYFRPLLIISEIWKETGWGTIIYFAALCNIPQEIYEAAIIDGAGKFQRIIRITIPSIAPVISMMFILSIGHMTNGNFDQVYNLYNPMVYDVGDVIDTYIFRVGLGEGKFSMGTSIGLFQNCINLALLLTANKLSKLTGGKGLY